MVKIYSQHENTVIWWTAFFIKIPQHVSFVKAEFIPGAYLAFSGCCKAKKKSKYLNSKEKDQNH